MFFRKKKRLDFFVSKVVTVSFHRAHKPIVSFGDERILVVVDKESFTFAADKDDYFKLVNEIQFFYGHAT